MQLPPVVVIFVVSGITIDERNIVKHVKKTYYEQSRFSKRISRENGYFAETVP